MNSISIPIVSSKDFTLSPMESTFSIKLVRLSPDFWFTLIKKSICSAILPNCSNVIYEWNLSFFFKKKFKIFGYLQIPLISSSRRTILLLPLFSSEVAVLLLLAVVSTLGHLLCISLVEISLLIFSQNLFCSDIVVNVKR